MCSYSNFNDKNFLSLIFTALHVCMAVVATSEMSVHPSVKCVNCDKTKETSAHILIPHEREWSGGRPLVPEILGQTDPTEAKTPIFNRYSLTVPQP